MLQAWKGINKGGKVLETCTPLLWLGLNYSWLKNLGIHSGSKLSLILFNTMHNNQKENKLRIDNLTF